MSFQNLYKGSIIKREMIATHTFQHTFFIGCNSHGFHQIMWDPYKFGGTQVSFNQSKECVKKCILKCVLLAFLIMQKKWNYFPWKPVKVIVPFFLFDFFNLIAINIWSSQFFLPIIDIDKIKCTYFPNGKELFRKNLALNYIIRIKVEN